MTAEAPSVVGEHSYRVMGSAIIRELRMSSRPMLSGIGVGVEGALRCDFSYTFAQCSRLCHKVHVALRPHGVDGGHSAMPCARCSLPRVRRRRKQAAFHLLDADDHCHVVEAGEMMELAAKHGAQEELAQGELDVSDGNAGHATGRT